VAARSKAWVWVSSLAGITGSNPAGGTSLSRGCCLMSGRGLCIGLMTEAQTSVVCLRVIVKPSYRGGSNPLVTVAPLKELYF
jgi:hypothetical protein